MLFGYLSAIVTGFLFTAIPNWTGRMPIQGRPLIFLVVLWVSGRFAVGLSMVTGWLTAAIVDTSFLASVMLIIAREIVAGKNYRNLKILLPLTILLLANIVFHAEVAFEQEADLATRLGFAAVTLLVSIIGGRIIPSFTRNWLVKQNPGLLPKQFGNFDKFVIVATGLSLGLWCIKPEIQISAVLLISAGLLQIIRLLRWAGHRTLTDPLVVILHVSYGFLAIGILALGLSTLSSAPVTTAAALHLLGIGGMGGMTLSVMVRASRGHTGLSLNAGISGRLCFSAIILATLFRASAEVFPEKLLLMLHLTAIAWMVAFGSYALGLGPALLKARRPDR